ncbi:acyl-phosphate glycerol-3-phosphate acyltransferase [Halothece sp. PCC 7418]|uniref:glycerol-3-phosphate 1-O-acyltransferase PlsY n=1 Tax=Halothece sp. (strain PCC 7418) TaxID=65093 RepID=UPI0002A05E84|nr:glycerol-3-phosphate 1-O-acyltransferase PlsY [Halothece sp. PCC 7418]AFZ43670.1 acyl-phosphate glycerol-3-phosphate acyltransferase [Halothece sp. PCC 7418]
MFSNLVFINAVLLLAAYLLGSIPTGFLAGYWLQKIDIREYGSGSTGATNVLRVLGAKAAVAVLLIDLLKGAIAVGIAKMAVVQLPALALSENWTAWLIILTALTAVFGHSKSVWLNFSGGKSVATSLGTLLIMTPGVALAGVAAFGVTLAASRMVSLSSLVSAIAINIFMVSLGEPFPYIIFAICAGLYVFWRHRSNVERILAGTEPKIGQKVSN